ncbi:UNKNOWN [Stylonychia lemnae]|uniref:Morn repeat protein n=1 Tax=Stylonychia lemnae TaxID=5949 RepID=A0A078B843_STYLE|nr:UNKNOWN [Stylonychia lemnae]|eukprot:CDW90685.1 UNKNOWN [Stylonychia lemnae]
MISNLFDFNEIKQSDVFAIKHYKDAIYRGQCQEKKRYGKGVIAYHSGRIYEGDWFGDKRHGRGFEQFVNGNTYQGDYIEGKAHGKGLFTWEHGEVYDGEWVNGVKEGYGIWKGIHGDSYIGQWKNSKADGYGVHQWKNGDKYEGEWKACLRHGNGSDFFSNGDQYVGQYQFGNPNGFGQYKWANGNSYAGEFKEGMKNGKGKWKKCIEPGQKVSNHFEGEYQDDQKHGYGEFNWQSGNKYKGYYENDQRNGYGEMYWKDGTIYKGYWENGVQNGLGIFVFPDGFKRIGFFEQNVYKSNVETIDQYQQFRIKNPDKKIPEGFKQEIKEYLGYYDHDSEADENFIDKEFKKAEREDPPEETAFKTMQDLRAIQDLNDKDKKSNTKQNLDKDMLIQQNESKYGQIKPDEKFMTLRNKHSERRNFNTKNLPVIASTLIKVNQNSSPSSNNYGENDKLIYHDFDYMRKITPMELNQSFHGSTGSVNSIQTRNFKQFHVQNNSIGQFRSSSRMMDNNSFSKPYETLPEKKIIKNKTPLRQNTIPITLNNNGGYNNNRFQAYLRPQLPPTKRENNLILRPLNTDSKDAFDNSFIESINQIINGNGGGYSNINASVNSNGGVTRRNGYQTQNMRPLNLRNKVWRPTGKNINLKKIDSIKKASAHYYDLNQSAYD